MKTFKDLFEKTNTNHTEQLTEAIFKGFKESIDVKQAAKFQAAFISDFMSGKLSDVEVTYVENQKEKKIKFNLFDFDGIFGSNKMLEWPKIYGLIVKDRNALATVHSNLIESTRYSFMVDSISSFYSEIARNLYIGQNVKENATITSLKYKNIELIKQ